MDGTGGISPAIVNPWQQNALTPKSSSGKSRCYWFTGTQHKVAVSEEDDLPVLKLTHFTKKVMVCFDKVRLGASKTCQLCVENPFDYPQELVVEKFPYKKGFTIPEDRWEFEEMENRGLPITWTPSEAGNARELVTFKCDGAFRLQVILLGTAEEKVKGKTRRGTFLFKKSNGNVRKAPGKVGSQRPQQNGSTTASTIYQQPRASHPTRATKQQKPAQKHRSNIGKENIPRRKDTMLKEVLNPARQTMVITKKPSPKKSPLQERTSPSPFQSVDTSLVEITNTTSPDTDKHTRRSTLSLCEGMSPLLQTSFVYCGDINNSKVQDFNQEVFNDSIEIAPSQTVTKHHSSLSKPAEIAEVNVRRISKDAQATVTKEKAPSLTPPLRRQSRRALFGNQVQSLDVKSPATKEVCATVTESKEQTVKCDDHVEAQHALFDQTETQTNSTQESNIADSNKLQVTPESMTDETTVFEINSPASSVVTLPSPPDKAQLFPVHESTTRKKLTGKRKSDVTKLNMVIQKCQASPEITPGESIAFEVPSASSHASKCATNESEIFPVHESAVTKKLTSKRKSDPTNPDVAMHKKLKSQATKKPETKKQPVSSTKGTQQANNKIRKSQATFEPNRGMTRTMMLRRAAAGVTAYVSKPKPTKAKRPVKGVPMAKLNLVKPNRTALPRHPMPFAAKNMFYDERWMEKQEQGFTRWLNYVLTPDDCPTDPSCKATKIDAGALFVEANKQITVALAPSKEDLSLRAYTARRKLNRLRRSACLLFQSEPVIRVIQKVEFEVERGGLKIRTDRKIHADYGIKQKLLNMFLSYNPLWLRIGLETVYGEILPIQSNTDIIGLSRFVVQRLLWNPDIAQKYVHPTVPGLYGPGYEKTLCQFTLKKFLLLVFFLDRAKLTRLIDHDPCLFCKDSEYKSSRAMLLEFSRAYLQGEGDVTKHLSYYGYVVTHTQTALHEFDFAVSKLVSDLRCGVRLARVVELLTKNWTLSCELRVPAISRLQKIHNTEVALKALKEHGIDVEGGGVNTRAIVDGHREKTLELLWRIIFYFQVEVMLNENQIKEEIIFLKRHLKLQHDLTAMEMRLDGTLGLTRDRRQSVEPNVYFKSQRLSLLLQWCQAVCHFYGLKVENFTVSFSDGRALCYLVHHYHPSLLPLDAIQQETTQTQYQRTESPSKSDADDSFDGTWANSYSPSTGKPGEYDRLLANERHNYKMLYEKVKELGGIPMMIKSTEMSNTIPDEKVVIVYVSYLCARLLDLRKETRAARTIQLRWRAHRLKRIQKERQIQIAAASKIQGAIRDFLTRRRHARILATVIKMQALLRSKLARRQVQRLREERLEKKQCEAAVIIQSQVKRFLEQRRFKKLKASTILLQSAIRGYLVRQHKRTQCQAAFTIQSRYRAWKLMQLEHSHYLSLRSAAITVQSLYRGRAARKEVRRVRAARALQAQWRGYLARRMYSIQKHSAIAIQAWFRMCLVRREYLEIYSSTLTLQRHIRAYLLYKHQKRAAITIQALVRGYLVRQHVKKMNHSAVCIQSNFRAYIKQKHFQEMKWATRKVQTIWRATLLSRQHVRSFQICRGACITMQACVRGFLVRQRVRKMNHAATCIQSNYRAHLHYTHYKKLKRSAVVLQTFWRSTLQTRKQIQEYQITRNAVITIQAWARGSQVRQNVRKMQNAATLIQSNYRAHRDYAHYQMMKKSATVIQTHWRSTLQARRQAKEYQIIRGAVITIQAWARGAQVRQNVRKMHNAATLIQSNYRAHRDYAHYQMMKKSATVIQTHWRSTLQARRQAKEYQIIRGAVITIQAWARGAQVRQNVRKMHNAATLIQSNYRAHRDYAHYQMMKKSAIVIQTHWRSTLQARRQAKEYQIIRGAAITIQACVRGFHVRQQLKKMHNAATCIQTSYRTHRDFTHYQKMKKSAVVLQMYWRSALQTKHQGKVYMITRGAVITIQAWVRGFLIRQRLKKQNTAAVCIQANYRAHLTRRSYQQTREAIMTLQKYWKATLLAKKQKAVFQVTRSLCILIQAYVRGFLIRQEVQRMHSAATCIQTNFRAHHAYKKYQKVKQAVKVLQTYWRATLIANHQRKEYRITRGAAITIQAWFRGYLTRQQIKKMNSAATCIQSNFRACRDFAAYQKMREGAKTIQVYWRATLLARKEMIHYQIMRGACITIQAWVRGFQTRHHLQKMGSAATCIQSSFRGYQARIKYQNLKKAASVLQIYWKAIVLGRGQYRDYNKLKSAAVVIQAVFRGRQARDCAHKERAARAIQAMFRMHVARQAYLKQRQAAILIQAQYRAHKVKQLYKRMKSSAIIIQKFYRGLLLTRQIQFQFAHNRDCIIKIQSTFRMFFTRKAYMKKKMAAVRIQAKYRAYKASTEYKKQKQAAIAIQKYYREILMTRLIRSNFIRTKVSVVKIQSYYRMHVQHKQYQNLKQAATIIQAYARGKAAYMQYKRLKQATILIQARYRATLEARQEQLNYQYTRGAIITIQALFRGYRARKHLHQVEQAVKILQIHWRATLQSKHAKQEYQNTRKACIILQAAVRGFLLRHQVQKMHLAATCIQANFRMHRDYSHYQRMKQAVSCLQIRWRATLQMKQQVRKYHVARGACVTIQSCVRGFLARQKLRKMNSAAICIQKNYRMHLDYKHYQDLKQSAKVLQRYWRATLLARQQIGSYQITRGAVITIQACVRGFLIRQQVKKMKHAAICVQSNFRAYMEQKSYQKKKQAVQTIQMYWRATLVARQQTMRYQISRGAVMTMQAWVRGFLVRQHIRKMHHAATCIQSNYRAHRDYMHYQKVIKSVSVLQSYWRSALKTKQQAKKYQYTRGAVITIQSLVRGFLIRQQIKRKKAAAVCIQANYRAHQAFQSYQQVRKATLILQKYWRATLQAKKQTREYQVTRTSCITIQAYIRGFQLRQQVQKMHSAATCIQASYRAHRACKEYQMKKQAAKVVQTYLRATLIAKKQRRGYQLTRGATITIQAWVRGHLIRQHIKRMNAAATCIQSNFRAYCNFTAYQKLRQSAKTLQVYWRATMLARSQTIQYQITRGACITIQAWVRGFLAHRHLQKMHHAATCIQRNFRGYQARTKYKNLRCAASVLQTRWRAVLLCRAQQNNYAQMKGAAIVIQALFRGRQARSCAHRERSARTIQATYRMHLARQAYLRQKQAAIVIQAKYRAHSAQKSYQRMKSSAVVIQKYYRGLLKMRQVQSQYMATKDSIIKIQSTFRMFVKRKSYLKKKSAATRIQAEYRAYKEQRQYNRQRKAAVVIQKYYRSVLLTRQTRSNFEKTKESIVKIQAYYRMHVQHEQYLSLRRAATVLQAYARGKAASFEYKRMKHAALVIQTTYRATLEARKQQLDYKNTRRSIIMIQALFRGHQARKLACQIRAAVTIQAVYRGLVQKRRYQLLKKSVILLQALVRGHQAREMFAEMQRQWNAAVCIQKSFRGYIARKDVEALRQARLAQVHRFAAAAFHHLCAIRLQRTYRNYHIRELAKQRLGSIIRIQQWWRARLERIHYTKLQRGIVLLQRAVRRHQKVRNAAAITLQSYARVWLARQYVRKLKASALKIQCMWRGYKVRAANKSKKVAAARARCIAANAAATEEKKLCNRTTSALDYLLQYKNLSYILEALMNLDVVTRLSPICCERLVDGKAVPVLYTLIRSCNRSQPCKEVIKYSVSILLNLVKYSKTTQAVFDVPDSVATIVDLMQIYREKGTLIFCQTCLLLGTLSQDSERAKAIHSMPKITEKIKSIHRLTERKHKMDGKRIDAQRRSLNASRLGSSFLNSSRLNSSIIPGTTLKRRRVQPDWVLGRDRMREIQDPMHAILFLMDALKLLHK